MLLFQAHLLDLLIYNGGGKTERHTQKRASDEARLFQQPARMSLRGRHVDPLL